MIKVNEGVLEVRGSRVTILADLAIIAHSLCEKADFTKEELVHAIELGCDGEDAVKDRMVTALEKLLKNLKEGEE